MTIKNTIANQKKKTEKVIEKATAEIAHADDLVKAKTNPDTVAVTQKSDPDLAHISLEELAKNNGALELGPTRQRSKTDDKVQPDKKLSEEKQELTPEQYETLKKEITHDILAKLIPIMQNLELAVKSVTDENTQKVNDKELNAIHKIYKDETAELNKLCKDNSNKLNKIKRLSTSRLNEMKLKYYKFQR
ncbi:MAG: hypothetical protein JKY92_09965 [Magnetovibrio sp.]|nr:hypothetical protein [Magnetovibrio sp.]